MCAARRNDPVDFFASKECRRLSPSQKRSVVNAFPVWLAPNSSLDILQFGLMWVDRCEDIMHTEDDPDTPARINSAFADKPNDNLAILAVKSLAASPASWEPMRLANLKWKLLTAKLADVMVNDVADLRVFATQGLCEASDPIMYPRRSLTAVATNMSVPMLLGGFCEAAHAALSSLPTKWSGRLLERNTRVTALCNKLSLFYATCVEQFSVLHCAWVTGDPPTTLTKDLVESESMASLLDRARSDSAYERLVQRMFRLFVRKSVENADNKGGIGMDGWTTLDVPSVPHFVAATIRPPCDVAVQTPWTVMNDGLMLDKSHKGMIPFRDQICAVVHFVAIADQYLDRTPFAEPMDPYMRNTSATAGFPLAQMLVSKDFVSPVKGAVGAEAAKWLQVSAMKGCAAAMALYVVLEASGEFEGISDHSKHMLGLAAMLNDPSAINDCSVVYPQAELSWTHVLADRKPPRRVFQLTYTRHSAKALSDLAADRIAHASSETQEAARESYNAIVEEVKTLDAEGPIEWKRLRSVCEGYNIIICPEAVLLLRNEHAGADGHVDFYNYVLFNLAVLYSLCPVVQQLLNDERVNVHRTFHVYPDVFAMAKKFCRPTVAAILDQWKSAQRKAKGNPC